MRAARPGTVRLTLGPLPEQAIGSWLGQVRDGAPTGEEIRLLAQATGGEPVRIRDQLAATAAAGPRVPSAWLAAAAITADDLVIDTALVARMLDLADADADREERNARRLAWIDTSAGVRFTHGSHRDDVIARLDTDPGAAPFAAPARVPALTERVRDATTPTPASPSASRGTPWAPTVTCPPPRRPVPSSPPPAPSGRAARPRRRGPGPGSRRTRPTREPGRACTWRSATPSTSAAPTPRPTASTSWPTTSPTDRPLDRAEALIRLARRWTDPGKIDWYLLQRPARRHRRPRRGRFHRKCPAGNDARRPSRSACGSPPTWPASPPWRSRSSAPRPTASGGRACASPTPRSPRWTACRPPPPARC